MDWDNLKTLNCPTCYGELEVRAASSRVVGHRMFECEKENCYFTISESRLREVVEEMLTKNNDHHGRMEFEDLMEAL